MDVSEDEAVGDEVKAVDMYVSEDEAVGDEEKSLKKADTIDENAESIMKTNLDDQEDNTSSQCKIKDSENLTENSADLNEVYIFGEDISEDELPTVQAVFKFQEIKEISDEELPGPKRAGLSADTEVFERGLKSIPLSVDLWVHYLTYVKMVKAKDEDFVRSQFERALAACGLEFRWDHIWDSYIKWETESKRLQRVTGIYDRLLGTPTEAYRAHFESFQEHIMKNPPYKVVEVEEFLELRKEVRKLRSLKHDSCTSFYSDAPPGDEDPNKMVSTQETKLIRERIISIRQKMHKNTVTAVTSRWNYEEGIKKRPYFHIKPLEQCQLKTWREYLDYEIQQGYKTRTIVLFERCLIACALYEEFWIKFVHYLESLKGEENVSKIRDVFQRACTIYHLEQPNLHLQWALFEESNGNCNRAAEILVNLEKSVSTNLLLIANRRIGLERRRCDYEKCTQLFEQYINGAKSKTIASKLSINYARFTLHILKNYDKTVEVIKSAITKDPTNSRLYSELMNIILQNENHTETEKIEFIDQFLKKEGCDLEQKILLAERKLEYLEVLGSDIKNIEKAYEERQKLYKQGGRDREINLRLFVEFHVL